MTLSDQLRRDEGERPRPYKDDLGNWTWGIGHNLTNPLSHLVIDLLAKGDVEGAMLECLGEDIAAARGGLTAVLPWYWALSDARRGVIENMAFNLGIGGLLGFRRMLAHCQAGEWDAAARAMLDSKWAGQVGDRAGRLAEQMRTDAWV